MDGVLWLNRHRMKRITLLLMALGLGAPVGFAQGNRIVCDETCRIEYKKTETPLSKRAETVKPAAKTTAVKQVQELTKNDTMFSCPKITILIDIPNVGTQKYHLAGLHPTFP